MIFFNLPQISRSLWRCLVRSIYLFSKHSSCENRHLILRTKIFIEKCAFDIHIPTRSILQANYLVRVETSNDLVPGITMVNAHPWHCFLEAIIAKSSDTSLDTCQKKSISHNFIEFDGVQTWKSSNDGDACMSEA